MIARKTQKIIYNIVIICLLIGGVTYVCSRFIHLGNIEYTDNAQVKQHITPINTRVPGFIKKIYFDEYQQVRKGDTLLIIEDAEFRLRVAQAEADLANATAGRQATTIGIATTQNNLSVSDASIEEVRVQMENAKRELNRFEKLLQEDAVTKQQYDNVHTAYEAAKARYEQVSRAKMSTSLVKSEQTHRLGQNEAGVRLAEAALELARLNLSYTVIIAPCDGTTGKKEILEGQLVQPGQTMVDIVDSSDLWVIANYRETQLPNIKEGARSGNNRRRRAERHIQRSSRIHLRCNRSRLLNDSARQRHRKLRESGATYSRTYQSERKQTGRFKTHACRF